MTPIELLIDLPSDSLLRIVYADQFHDPTSYVPVLDVIDFLLHPNKIHGFR